MSGRGLRRYFQPVLYIGIALLAHGLLLLVPWQGPSAPRGKEGPKTVRGMKLKTFAPAPPPPPPGAPPPSAAAPPPPPPPPAASGEIPPNAPPAPKNANYSMMGAAEGGGKDARTTPGREGAPTGAADRPPQAGAPGPEGAAPSQGRQGEAPKSDFGNYLSRLRSTGVQGWAKESAQKMRQGWRGSGQGGSGDGWGGGGQGGSGAGGGGGGGTGGSGGGEGSGFGTATGSGRGSGRGGDSSRYLDPRVRMVVIRYPIEGNDLASDKARNIEGKYRQVPYPEIKVKATGFSAGWQSVYMKLRTDASGNVVSRTVLRPEGSNPMERTFIDTVQKSVARWEFDPGDAEIHVDVRFYVE